MAWGRTLFLAAAVVAFCAPQARAQDGMEQARAIYMQLRDPERCVAALPQMEPFTATPAFVSLAPELQQGLLAAALHCAAENEDYPAAIRFARGARDAGADWADHLIMLLGMDSDDHALVVQGFDDMMARTPAKLAELELSTVWRVLNAAGEVDASGARELQVHETLVAANYIPPNAAPDDGLRKAHARLLLARGQVDRARERLSTVTGFASILSIRVDRAFDALRADPDFEQRHDLRRAAEAQLTRSQERAAANPRSLAAVQDVVQSLRLLNRPQDALAEADRALERAQGPRGSSLYDDHGDYLNWLLNERSYILYDLGRAEEARTTFGMAIGAGEGGGSSNVSQVINFASRLQAEGRAREALEVVSTVGPASPYGDMWAATVRVCAAVQLNNTRVRNEAIRFLRENEDENPAALTAGLLCINDLDSAAAAYIRRLNDEEHRENAILALQIYQDPPSLSAFEVEQMRRQARVRDRADVQAALNAVGRAENVPFRSIYWGDV